MFTRQSRSHPTIWRISDGPAGNIPAAAGEQHHEAYARAGELRNPPDVLLESLDCRGHHLREIADNRQRSGGCSTMTVLPECLN
jgi:hypothetical protein